MAHLSPATLKEFVALADQGNVIPVVKTVVGDLLTPVSAYLKIYGRSPYSFLLESVQGNERLSRYSFLGTTPHLIARARGGEMLVTTDDVTEIQQVTFLDGLRRYMGRFIPAQTTDLPPFAGGAVGYLAYDAARFFEDGPPRESTEPADDDGVMMFFSTVIAFDHATQEVKIIVNVPIEGRRDKLEEAYRRAIEEIQDLEAVLNAPPVPPARRKRTESPALSPRVSKEKFQELIEQVKERIRDGEVFQAVISQQFEFNIACHPFQIYRALRRLNPQPYMFYLSMDDTVMIGGSSDMLLRCTDRKVECRAVSGNQPRGKTETEDELLDVELTADENEVAEHTILLDVARNDIGRVTDFGTFEVSKYNQIERTAQLVQVVSSVRGQLRVGCDRFDALKACFPAAAVSGVPKISAVKLIAELEPIRRGIYGGAVMYLDYSGNLDACCVQRSIAVTGKKASIQAGVGISADSQSDREFVETVNKVRPLIKAIELGEKEL